MCTDKKELLRGSATRLTSQCLHSLAIEETAGHCKQLIQRRDVNRLGTWTVANLKFKDAATVCNLLHT